MGDGLQLDYGGAAWSMSALHVAPGRFFVVRVMSSFTAVSEDKEISTVWVKVYQMFA